MAYALGFVVAIAIGLTGVGAGSLTTPLLILLLGLSPRISVGTALIFGFVLKIITAPVYMARKQVSWRTLAYMLAGGVPGVLIGVFLLRGLDANLISGIIGLTVMIIAIFNLFRPRPEHRKDKTRWLAAVAFPIGIGLALVVGVIWNYFLNPQGNPILLGTGVALVAGDAVSA